MTDETDAPSRHPLAALWAPQTIRARCANVLRSVENGASAHFKLDRSRLPAAAERVAAELLRSYPDLQLPSAGCWPLFDAGGVPRLAELAQALAGRSAAQTVQAQVDLTVVTALMAGHAGEAWCYSEATAVARQALPAHRQDRNDLLAQLDQAAAGRLAAEPAAEPAVSQAVSQAAAPPGGASLQGREGLAVATLRAFMAGAFSAHPDDPLRADAKALALIDPAAMRAIFQARPSNPLLGLEGRAAMLARLGQTLLALMAHTSASSGLSARPCLLYERLSANTNTLTASALLQDVLRSLGPVWDGVNRSRVLGLPAGDVGAHLWAGAGTGGNQQDAATGGYVPLHQLAQGLCLSLVQPLQTAGLAITGLDALSGLPGPASAGFFIDAGVIVPRQASTCTRTWKTADEGVVEWRALTVVLLDELATLVRRLLDKTALQCPLASLQQWGIDVTGRALAAELRPGGAAPLKVESDGSVF